MSMIKTLKCDGEKCGKLWINDPNHWLQGVVFSDAVLVSASTADLEARYFDRPVDVDTVKHFCGESCANKWVSQQLSKLRG